MNGGLALAVATFAVSSYVVGNAYMQKQQFYPTVVHLTKSNSYMAVRGFLWRLRQAGKRGS